MSWRLSLMSWQSSTLSAIQSQSAIDCARAVVHFLTYHDAADGLNLQILMGQNLLRLG